MICPVEEFESLKAITSNSWNITPYVGCKRSKQWWRCYLQYQFIRDCMHTDNISVFYELLIENFTLGVIMCLLHGDVLCKINTITLTVTVSISLLKKLSIDTAFTQKREFIEYLSAFGYFLFQTFLTKVLLCKRLCNIQKLFV